MNSIINPVHLSYVYMILIIEHVSIAGDLLIVSHRRGGAAVFKIYSHTNKSTETNTSSASYYNSEVKIKVQRFLHADNRSLYLLLCGSSTFSSMTKNEYLIYMSFLL